MADEELITFLAYEGGGEVSVRPESIIGLIDLPDDMANPKGPAQRTRIDVEVGGNAVNYLVKQPASYIRRAMVRALFKAEQAKNK